MVGLTEDFLKLKQWEKLNEIQNEAIKQGLLEGKLNFLIFAPTGSGKTAIAEMAVYQELLDGGKAIYTVPSHALIAEKLKEFKYLKSKFKVAEGKSSFAGWKDSDVIVTTFELLYRACLFSKEFLKDFKIVIIDEFHILYDDMRGYNLEKLLTILKENKARVFCISATFEDKKEASDWLSAKVIEIPNQLRVVPIKYDIIDLTKKRSDLASEIVKIKKEPYLIFCSTKPYTKERAEETSKLLSVKKNDKERIVEDIKEATRREDLSELEISLCNCLETGVGFHHSDLSQEVRNYIADMFIDRKIDYLFTTTGLAYGINFPAKTVVVADLSLYDLEDKKSNPLPVHTFLQMAGRAGRPQFGNEGFCFAVMRKAEDFTKIQECFLGHITKAFSKISRDDFFFKAILELVYSGRSTEGEICYFFEKSFFNFQASRTPNLMVPFNLRERLATRMLALCKAGFIEQMGVEYKLTPFGQITLDYLFSSISSPELSAFLHLKRYLDRQKTLKFDFDYVYFLSKVFSDCRISKQPREKAEEIETFLQNKGIVDRSHPEYSAYVVYHMWINNVKEADIDKNCRVYSCNLSAKMREMAKLVDMSRRLAEAENYPVSEGFDVLQSRIYYGVREDELPLVKIHGIKRELARAVKNYCDGVLTPLHQYTGTCMEILKALLAKESDEGFLRHMNNIQKIGEVRSRKILALVKAGST